VTVPQSRFYQVQNPRGPAGSGAAEHRSAETWRGFLFPAGRPRLISCDAARGGDNTPLEGFFQPESRTFRPWNIQNSSRFVFSHERRNELLDCSISGLANDGKYLQICWAFSFHACLDLNKIPRL